ncbi:ATP-binding cassette domain-containing protein [Nonomuraea endophytica]|uniref:ATP-binding cassette subfamily C protein n=1 Tax=Nonomuraea endophytica TaxID=714136 RepID=A0A7W8EM05_9ACTN|nr:ABC transporter ATP-binding protein [Nonomuraea endophytica]MBB5083457.1 ATP-binding cassette subfamily C protein [Nonomuraea endophytica]
MKAGRVVWTALRARPKALARIAAWSVVEVAPAFLIGLAIARAIDDGFAAGRVDVGLAWLAALGTAWLLAAFAARQVILAVAAVAEPFRDDLLTLAVRGALCEGPQDAPASAVARINLQVELARDAFAAVVTVVRGFAFTAAGAVLGLVALHPALAVLVLPPFVLGAVLFTISLPVLYHRQRAYLEADERTAQTLVSVTGGLRDVTACGAEERVQAMVGRRIAAQARSAGRLAGMTALRTAALGVGAWAPVVLILVGGPWVAGGTLGAGVIVGALAYVTQSLAPALGGLVEGVGVSGVRLFASLDRILHTTSPSSEHPASLEGPAALEGPAGEARPAADDSVALAFTGVSFSYGEHADPVVQDLDLEVRDGEHLAIVGPSGAGKSTLAALAAGLLRPGAGTVTVAGVPAHLADPATRVLIPQEAYAFRGSLHENLAYLSDAPPERILAAAREVGADELIERLGGLDADLDPGGLSAGERQLIALVRAHLAEAGLVILDEATCHLDPAAEARAEQAFVRRGGTLIVVAHRLTSARRAARVLLLDGSRASMGTHEELVAAAPLYADLVGHWESTREEAQLS